MFVMLLNNNIRTNHNILRGGLTISLTQPSTTMSAVETPREPPQVNSTCLDLLINEIVPLALRTTEELNKTDKDRLASEVSQLSIRDIDTGDVKIFDSGLLNSEEINYKVDNYGYSIGLRLSELMMFNNPSNEILKNLELLNIMKFICRDVWKILYGKQMDNLRTNHRGTFVLIDNHFKPFKRTSSQLDLADTIKKSKSYLWIPSGIIRGVLKSFGIDSLVTPEVSEYPAVTFNIQTNV